MSNARLEHLVDTIKNPKTWTKIVSADAELMAVLAPLIAEFNLTIPAAVYCVIHNTTPVCEFSNIKKFTWFAKGFAFCGTRDVCACNATKATAKAKHTNLAKFGVESFSQTAEYLEKTKSTNLKKFGVEHASHSSEVRQRAIETCIQRHGTAFPSTLDQFKNKGKLTRFQRHGDENYNNKTKRTKTLIDRYGVSNYSYVNKSQDQLDILLNKSQFCEFITGKSRQLAAQELRVDPNTIDKYVELYECANLLVATSSSKWETLFANLLTSLSVRYIQNTKQVIPPFELDFYLPELNIAFELNGNYWHSESMGKTRNYHFSKWQKCRELNIPLYQYFEDELIDHWSVIESKVKYLTGNVFTSIGARHVALIDNIQYNSEAEFLNKFHIQGESKSRNATMGAYYNDELVGILSWQQRTKYLEITRFATNTSAVYPGLFSKMLRRLITIKNYSGSIVSFSNNSHSNGNLYKTAGFTEVAIIGPAYWYTRDYRVRENRQQYMKTKIEKKFGVSSNGKTEQTMMKELGYDRIWDSGKIKWELIVPLNTRK